MNQPVLELVIKVVKTDEGALCKSCARKLLGKTWIEMRTPVSDGQWASGEFSVCYRCGKTAASFLF